MVGVVKLDEAEILMAIGSGDPFAAAAIVARQTGTELDLSQFCYIDGTHDYKHDPEIVIALFGGGCIAWSPAYSFIYVGDFFKISNPGTITMRAGRKRKKRSK